jgi:hypothetical protein
MLHAQERPGLPHLLRDLTADVSQLVRQEVALAKAELVQKASRIGGHLGSIAVAGGVLLFAGIALLIAAVYGLTALFNQFLPLGVAVWLAPLLLAVALGFFGLGLMKAARRALAQETIALTITAETLEENKQWLSSRTN